MMTMMLMNAPKDSFRRGNTRVDGSIDIDIHDGDGDYLDYGDSLYDGDYLNEVIMTWLAMSRKASGSMVASAPPPLKRDLSSCTHLPSISVHPQPFSPLPIVSPKYLHSYLSHLCHTEH